MRNLIILACCILLFSSCSKSWYQRRDVKKLDGLFIQQPVEAARLSNVVYPCFSGKAKSDTSIVYGKSDTTFRWIYNDPDTVKGLNITNYIYDTTFKTKVITITKPVYTTIHDTVPDIRAQAVSFDIIKIKQDSLTTVKTQLAAKGKAKNTWMWIAVACMTLIAATLAIKIYKFFSGGAVTSVIKKVL